MGYYLYDIKQQIIKSKTNHATKTQNVQCINVASSMDITEKIQHLNESFIHLNSTTVDGILPKLRELDESLSELNLLSNSGSAKQNENNIRLQTINNRYYIHTKCMDRYNREINHN